MRTHNSICQQLDLSVLRKIFSRRQIFFHFKHAQRARENTHARAHTHKHTHTHTQQPVIILKMGGKSAALRSVKTEIMQRLQ